MWELVLSLAVLLTAFSLSLFLALRQFSELLGKASTEQAKALAMIVEPMFRQPDQNQTQAVDLPETKTPGWADVADSPDLIDDLGRPLTWETPVISEQDSVGPADLWARPS